MSKHSLDIWLGRLAASPADLPFYRSLLDREERVRAQRIRIPQRQDYYAETHARLRLLLSETVNAAPTQLRFSRNAHGKPFLADFPDVAFNLSHTADRLAIAVVRRCRLGIDIETCKPRTNLSALAAKCFGAEEMAYWQSLPETERLAAFYYFWTRKEAFVKAVGQGISLGLQHCVINPAHPTGMLHIPASCGASGDWSLHDLDIGDGVLGAVAVDGPIAAMTVRTL
ncbi:MULTISPECIES: 4'-phosphopantetheinyl transferase family protein [Methylomicrobium]|uniref:Phosphopantetheinyl transferase n=1 Tax=Methylomicrobium album BG8 TaxID=686340 RepID=H8GR12_METAL|nr:MULTISPECIES: 4'-phosphopantetheinyl transferase superfamily protein [Methylomicrobium]EIC28671.1 phosphopantetheinyl transferase [Methylomicrobium album BG8]